MITFIDDEQNSSIQIAVMNDATGKGQRVLIVYETKLSVMGYEYFTVTKKDLEQLQHRLQYPLQYQHSVLELAGMKLSFGLTLVNKGITSFDVWCYLSGVNVRLHYVDYTGCNLHDKVHELESCTL